MAKRDRGGFPRTQLVEEVEVDLPSGRYLATADVDLWCEPDDEQVNMSVEGVGISSLIDPDGEEVPVPEGHLETVRKAVADHALSSEWVAEQATEDALDQGHRFARPGDLY